MDKSLENLLHDWNEVNKKSFLSFRILPSLSDGAKYTAKIAAFLSDYGNGNLDVKKQSLYRALRRFKAMKIININERRSPQGGPDRKYFALSATGSALLREFTRQNVRSFTNPDIEKRITIILNGDSNNDKINHQ